MAIRLPVAGAGGAGSTVARPRTAKLPGPGGVPQVSPASDPGLVIPEFGAPARALEGLGGVVSEIGDLFAKSAEKARTRKDAVERARAVSEFNEGQAGELRRIQTELDLSDEAVAQTYIQGGQKALAEALSKHAGSEDSKARLAIRLEGIRSAYATQASIISARMGLARIEQSMGESLNVIVDNVYQNPGSLDLAFEVLDAAIDDMAPALTPEQEINFLASGREIIAKSAIESFLDRGAFRDAKALFEDTPGLANVMSPEVQRSIRGRIAQFEAAEVQAAIAGQIQLNTLTTILGRQPTPQERARAAGVAPPVGRQTVAQKIAETEAALDRPLSQAERERAAGLEPPTAQSPEGKLIQDREMFVSQFGEDSEQVAAFDEATRTAGEAPSLSDIGGIRKEFTRGSGTFVDQRASFTRVNASVQDASPAGDLALIFNFMKILDPASVIRESEFAQAAATGSIGQRLQAAAERFLAGKRLTDTQRTDFAERAQMLFAQAVNIQLALEGQFRGVALRAGIRPADVVIDYLGPFRPGGQALPESGEVERPKPRFKTDLQGNILGAQ